MKKILITLFLIILTINAFSQNNGEILIPKQSDQNLLKSISNLNDKNSTLNNNTEKPIINSQNGLDPYLIVTPTLKTVSSESGVTTFSVASDVNWYVNENTDWLVASKSNTTTLTVSYDENISSNNRSAYITISGEGVPSVTAILNQESASSFLNITPSSKDVPATAGSTTFTVNSNVDWSVSEDSGWLSASKTNASTFTINYDENTSTDSRTATIDISGPGVSAQTVTLTQEGATAFLSVSPSSRTVTEVIGTTSFTVSSNVDWSVSETSGWLTATKTNPTTLTVTYDENTSTDSRTATIDISGPGVSSQTVSLIQEGVLAFLSVSPTSKTVSAAGGSTTFVVSSNVDWSVSETSGWLTATKTNPTTLTVTYDENTSADARSASLTISGTGVSQQIVTLNQNGNNSDLSISPTTRTVNTAAGSTTYTVNSNVDWSVSESVGWLTATKTNPTTLTVTYDENTSTDSRSATIDISGPGVSSQTVSLIQEGAAAFLSVSPSSRTVTTVTGTTTFTVSSNVDWSVSENSGWLSASKTNASTLTITYDENTSTDSRTATIDISGPGVSSQTVSLIQEGASAFLSVSPSSRTVTTVTGTTTFAVSSNIDWSVSENSGWLVATKTNASTLTITYDENTSTSPRSASISISGPGVSTKQVTIIQEGVIPDPILSVTPDSLTVSPGAGISTFNVISNIDWAANENENWITTTKTDNNTLIVDYEENLSENERSVSIIFSGNGVDPQEVILIQKGAVPTSLDDISEKYDLKIFPNPAVDDLHIQTEVDIENETEIIIFNEIGSLFYSKIYPGLYRDQRIKIDISGLKSGVYILKISNSDMVKIKKIIRI